MARRRRRQNDAVANALLLAALAFSLLPSLRASASPVASFLDFTFSDALCGSWARDYSALHARIRHAARSHATTLAQTAPPLDPSIRFLTYEWLDEPGGLADSLTGLATAFACALLTRRAFILRHPLLPLAFAPNLIDWSFSPDIPIEPARRIVVKRGVLVRPEWGGGGGGGGSVGGDGGSGGEEGGRRREGIVQEGEVVVVDLRNQFLEPEEFFALLDTALNVRLSWNRGLLTYWLVQAVDKKWSDRLKGMAMRPPYAFGCILRFLLKPQPGVIAKAEAMYHRLLSTPAPSSPLRQPHSPTAGHSGAPDGFSSHRVAVVGIHLRANDTFVWQGKEGFGEPKALSDGERGVLMAWADSYMACAEVGVVMAVEGFTVLIVGMALGLSTG
ncbi:unnamed protein product [Closterium sp. NIES-65]|nr:unnamed protein product [Closterium sp. NIES-65]